MGNINVSITHNGTAITSYVLDYTREINICSGVGTLLIHTDRTIPRNLEMGDTFILREEGNKIGEYYPNRIVEDPTGKITLECQDYSKYMQDYFVAKSYKANFGSSRYWIQRILDMAKISYNFTTDSYGYVMSENNSIGFDNAYNLVLRLCQQSGWYFYFDGNSVCQIGKLSNNFSNPSYRLKNSDHIILKQELVSDDDSVRNKVVVWGGAAPGSTTPFEVYTSITTTTPWDRDANDKRAIVYTNSYLTDLGTAYSLGKKLLDEYSQTLSVKTYEIAGYADVLPGEIGYFKTDIFKGLGRVTTIQSRVSNDGFKTILTVDERCPRIFGYWQIDTEYVYIGTKGDGVWRKPLDGSTWSNYSTGLTNLNIPDLKIKNGLFVCTSNDYRAFRREIIDSSWTELEPTGFLDEDDLEYDLTSLKCSGCGINENSGEFYVGYSDNTNNKSWLVTYYPDDTYIVEFVSTANNETEYIIKDTDTNNTAKILTVEGGRRVDFECDKVARYSGRYGQASLTMSGEDHMTSLEHITVDPDWWSSTAWDGSGAPPNVFPAFDGNNDTVYFIRKVGGTHYGYQRKLDAFSAAETITSSSDEIIVFHGFVEPEVSISAVYNSTAEEIYIHKTDFVAGSDSVITTISATNDMTPLYGGAIYTDGSDNLKIAVMFGEYDAAKNYIEKLHVSVIQYSTGSANTSTYTITPPTNTTIDLVYSYTECMPSSNDYVKAVLSVDTSSTDGTNPYYSVLYIISINKSTNVVSFGQEEGITSTPPDEHNSQTYTGLYNPVDNYFHFGTEEFNSEDKFGYISIGESSTSISSYTEIGDRSIVVPPTVRNSFQYSIFSVYGGHLVTNYTKDIYSVGAQESNIYSGYSLPEDSYPVSSKDDATNSIYYVDGTSGDVINERTSRTIGTLYATPETGFHAFIVDKILVTADRYHVQLFRQASGDPGVTSGSYILRRGGLVPSGHLFARLKLTEYPLNLEVSKETPTIAFGGSIDEDLPEMYISNILTSGQIYITSTTCLPYPSPMGYYSDARSADFANYIPDASTGWTASSEAPKRYVLTTRRIDGGLGGIYYRDSTDYFSSWTRAWTFSGEAHRLETTNYITDIPYVFVSTSGEPSGFFQLNPTGSSQFTSYSSGLPNSNILVIRCDDRI